MQPDSKRRFIATWKTLKTRLLTPQLARPSWTLNIDDKSNRLFAHLLIYPSAWLPFFPPSSLLSPPLHWYITFNWIPAMKFHPRHCSLSLFFSLPSSLIVLSRETILQPSFLAGLLSARLTPCIPSMPVPVSFCSDNCTFMYTRRALWIKRSWTKSRWRSATCRFQNGSGMRNNPHFTWKRVYVYRMQSRCRLKNILQPRLFASRRHGCHVQHAQFI